MVNRLGFLPVRLSADSKTLINGFMPAVMDAMKMSRPLHWSMYRVSDVFVVFVNIM